MPEPAPGSSSIAGPRRRWRWSIWLAIAALAIGGALAYRAFWFARPIGSGPAGPTVPRKPFEQIWTERPVFLLAAGDSITAGLGARAAEYGYVNRLLRNPADEFADMKGLSLEQVLPNLRVENRAVSGSTSIQHLDDIQRELKMQEKETLGIVLLTTGGNDLIHWYGQRPPREGAMYGATLQQAKPWIDSFRTRLERILDLIDERFPGGCHVLLADIYDPTDGVGDAPSARLPAWPDGLEIHAAYNRVIHEAAKNRANVHLVPLHQTFLGHGTHCRQIWRATYCREDPTYWFYMNVEDPNDRGHDAIRRVFLIELARIAPQLAE